MTANVVNRPSMESFPGDTPGTGVEVQDPAIGETSIHHTPGEWIASPSEPENPWLSYILHGVMPASKPDAMAAKRAASELAGTDVLGDAAVLERFRKVQFALSGNNEALFSSGDGWRSTDAKINAVNPQRVAFLRQSDKAACKDKDQSIFYPERGESTFAAKSLCHICVIRRECLQAALDDNEKTGILGGLSERQRKRIRRIPAKYKERRETLIEEMWKEDAIKVDQKISQKEAAGIDWAK